MPLRKKAFPSAVKKIVEEYSHEFSRPVINRLLMVHVSNVLTQYERSFASCNVNSIDRLFREYKDKVIKAFNDYCDNKLPALCMNELSTDEIKELVADLKDYIFEAINKL